MQSDIPNRYFDDPVFTLEGTAVVMLKTSFMNHEAAISLNEAYGLALTRIDDLELNNGRYPIYIYYNPASRLSFIMISAPLGGTPNPCFEYYDKMLFIRGRDARQFQQRIYDDLTNPQSEPDSGDPLQHNRWEMLDLLCQGVFEPATVNFTPSGTPVTSLYSGPADTLPQKLQKQFKNIKKFLGELYTIFEWHLTDPAELADITPESDDSAPL